MKKFVIGLRILLLMVIVGTLGWYGYDWWGSGTNGGGGLLKKNPYPRAGQIVASDEPVVFSTEQVLQTSRQNFRDLAPQPKYGVTKKLVKYVSYDLDGKEISVYARVYAPANATGKAPIFAFAPGTTGMGDQCAASLEQPTKVNWANYESHMVTFAGQGYAAVITDYEGMRDEERIHHYMIGELEGRAVLDSVRAAKNTAPELADNQKVVVAGFSQGGHSAFWADKIAVQYAPEIRVKGVIGFGPVTDVTRTLADAALGANINWFGPYVLTSFADYYGRTYNLGTILQPKWTVNTRNDVLANCIDTNPSFWGRNPAEVYTPDFLQALKSNNLANAGYAQLAEDLKRNTTTDSTTRTPKFIAQGQHDNVILPAQQTSLLPVMCKSAKGPIQLTLYPTGTHYNVIPLSYADVTRWMNSVIAGQSVNSNCPTK
jgi:acetyl esterase/lipase